MFERNNIIYLDQIRAIRNLNKNNSINMSRRFPVECLLIPVSIVCSIAALSLILTILN